MTRQHTPYELRSAMPPGLFGSVAAEQLAFPGYIGLRALLPAGLGDDFQSSERSKQAQNPDDQHPEEER